MAVFIRNIKIDKIPKGGFELAWEQTEGTVGGDTSALAWESLSVFCSLAHLRKLANGRGTYAQLREFIINWLRS